MVSPLSQGHLTLLDHCPRKFQYVYLEHQSAPVSWVQSQSAAWGTLLHRVLQQMELGLPVEPLLAHDPALARSISALRQAAPHLFGGEGVVWRKSEHRRSLWFSLGDPEEVPLPKGEQADVGLAPGFGLVMVYDWIQVQADGTIALVDWKTYQRIPPWEQLAHHWQTRLYLYGLAATTTYAPEALSLTYWFVAPPGTGESPQPQGMTFAYDRAQHQQIEADLRDRLRQLHHWLHAYQTQGEPLPQLSPTASACSSCGFQDRCQRRSSPRTDTLGGRFPPLDLSPEALDRLLASGV
jgi:hypothetical protein